MLNVADAPPATWTNSDQSEVPLTIVYDPSKNTILFTETPGAISDPLIPVVGVPLIFAILDPSYLTTAFTEPLSRTGSIDTSSLLLLRLLLRFPEIGVLSLLLNHLFHRSPVTVHRAVFHAELHSLDTHMFTPLCFNRVTLFTPIRI